MGISVKYIFFSRLLILIFLFSPRFIFSEPAVKSSSDIDWKKGELLIEVDINYPPESEKLRMRNNSENLFDDMFFDIFISSVSKTSDGKVYYNSYYSMADKIQQTPSVLNKIDLIKKNAVMVYNVYNKEMSGVKMLYKINLFRDVAAYFIDHKVPRKPAEKYLWVPNKKYTGVVIYAKGEYPVHGESKSSSLYMSVYPSVYSKDMELLLSAELTDPEYLKKWGTAGFTDMDQDPQIIERVGEHPLYTMAEEIFGRNRTDAVVPSETADLLLYNNLNADLIREGRFVIICDLP